MRHTWIYGLCLLLAACQSNIQVTEQSDIVSPMEREYADMVIPCNIAPLNFFLGIDDCEAIILIYGNHRVTALCDKGAAIPDVDEWKKLLSVAKGERVQVLHCLKTEQGWKAYRPFYIRVSADTIDPYLVYRLIPPGYEIWNEMGIYQRNLETFEEKPLLTNKQTGMNCMNCHSFCNYEPDKMMLHLRANHAGTLLINGDSKTKLDTRTEQTIAPLVYPYWHPGGKYIAYSVNDTKQLFHTNHQNRIEVMDLASDVVVYDVEKNRLLTTPPLFSEERFETFPAFSPDGSKLYFCTAARMSMPDEYNKVRYSLCSIEFNEAKGTFGQTVDTLFQADVQGKSASFPRVSPDGRFLMMTLSEYGNFSIWHQEADLWMIDLISGELKYPDALNSSSVESYHCWSSNSRWVVFSSRRGDGLYTRPYISYVDAEGTTHKPFVLPQQQGDYYQRSLYSYNIPEFVKDKVKVSGQQLAEEAIKKEALKVGPLLTTP